MPERRGSFKSVVYVCNIMLVAIAICAVHILPVTSTRPRFIRHDARGSLGCLEWAKHVLTLANKTNHCVVAAAAAAVASLVHTIHRICAY